MAEKPPALSTDTRAVLATYRDATRMPKAARGRVHARLSETGSARPVWLWVGVGALAAGLLLWAVVGVSDALRANTEMSEHGTQAPMQVPRDSGETAALVPTKAPEPTTRQQIQPQPLLQPDPTPLEELQTAAPAKPLPSAPGQSQRRPKGARPSRSVPTPGPAPASRLGAENLLITRTWEHIRSEHYSKARGTLAEHAAEFPSGVLAPERVALDVIVNCLQHRESAAGKADAYAASGRTTLLTKVRSACNEGKTVPK
ncbi:MAG: hypothetical protein KUG77_25135 [Nannocystaceae bacterium]|nr:hypothetical protein [Nannocystaceae bacterium]